jgi:hypothetical protein
MMISRSRLVIRKEKEIGNINYAGDSPVASLSGISHIYTQCTARTITES